jgi:hypothetical protein
VDATGAIDLLTTYASAGALSLAVQPGASGTNHRAIYIRADNCTSDNAIYMQCDDGGIELECGSGKAFTFDSAGGDCYQEFQLNGTGTWSIGIDDSDGDTFKINSGSSGLEDDSDFSLDSSGNAEFGGSVTCEGLVTTLSAKTANYECGAADYMIVASRSVTITLPENADAGRLYVVKRVDDGTSNGNITVSRKTSDTIDGATTYVLDANYMAATFISDGANWHVASDYMPGGE